MNILVCVKQVPDTTMIKIDPVKHTLIREGVPAILNPFDGYALEAAARVKDKNPDTKITVVTMGPPQATAVLKECVGIAADKGYLVSGRTFGGSDTLATSYALSGLCRVLDYDLIIAGRQAIDGDTAQVGPELAEHLDLPQITYVADAKLLPNGNLQVDKENEDGIQVLEVEGKCLLTVLASAFEARYMSVSGIMEAYDKEVEVWSADKIDVEEGKLGLAGSPTKVFKSFPKAMKAPGEVHEVTPEEAVELIVNQLKVKHII